MNKIITQYDVSNKKERNYELRNKYNIYLNINTETIQMKKLRDYLEAKIPPEDLYLIDYVINKIWFKITYSEDIELKIKKYIF